MESRAVSNLRSALDRAMASSPKVGGFPYLAEVLRKAGVKSNSWALPSCQRVYVTSLGNVAVTGSSLVDGMAEIPEFSEHALITALRADQAGETTFPVFLTAIWSAGVVRYEVDFIERKVSYYGSRGEAYIEDYPAVELNG